MGPNKKTKRFTFAEREEKILEAAESLFASRGFAGTTTKSIASRIGINEALLFRHYPSKEALYEAILKQSLSQKEIDLKPLTKRMKGASLEKALNHLALAMVEGQKKDPDLFRMMLFAALEDRKLGPLFFKQRLPIRGLLVEFFKDRRREISSEDPLILAQSFMAMIFHYVLVTQIFKAPGFYPKREKEMLKSFVRIFIRGARR